MDLKPLGALEGGDPAVFVQASLVGGCLDEPNRLETGGQAGLGFEPGVEIAAVEADRGRGVRRRAEAGHQAGRVPGGAGGESVAFEDDDVGPAEVGEVIGDRGADDPAPDDDDSGSFGQRRRRDRGWVGRWAGGWDACGRGCGGGAHRTNLSLAVTARSTPPNPPFPQFLTLADDFLPPAPAQPPEPHTRQRFRCCRPDLSPMPGCWRDPERADRLPHRSRGLASRGAVARP